MSERTKNVQIRLSEEEWTLIEEASTGDNTKLGTWIRERAIEAAHIWTGKGEDAPAPPPDNDGAGEGAAAP